MASTEGGGAAQVWYVEARGGEARDRLHAFLGTLSAQPGFLGAELLLSPAQPDLALVASRWAAAPPALPLPEGARAWTFEVFAAR
ncbi:antibiotic biosynthesis monooxygenase [uncultured Deinococcus sp.]|uniref:antibiotic biosynthesis monooxygenase n=1 Tax=uncultured Deinococcus sp. TaxID=158789 RepID=UPI00258E82F7|nr:antibiotic biosynthesis monooxygenase [uncultured Deinococcus sp.]